MVALPVLVSGLEAEMIRLGYKDSTLAWYHGAWRRLQRYFTFRGVEEFSLDVAMEWVDGRLLRQILRDEGKLFLRKAGHRYRNPVGVLAGALDVVGGIAGAAVGGRLVKQGKETVEADGGTINRGEIVGTHGVLH